MDRYDLVKWKRYYLSMKDEYEDEKRFYSEELKKSDWEFLKEASEMFLTHAYSHLFHISQSADKMAEYLGLDASEIRVFGDKEDRKRYSQFYLNLAVGLELLLKSILLKEGVKIHLRPEKTISLGDVIEIHLKKIFPKLIETTFQEIKETLRLINLRRNNIAHRSKKSYDSYAHEYRFSYITLYIYEKFFCGENTELTQLLLKSLDRSKVTQQSDDFKPLKIKPRSL